MSKVINEGWPDPTEWAKRLHDQLETLGADYIEAPWTVADDPNECAGINFKQALATEIVGTVAAALHELPSFSGSKGVAALHDVAASLRDVVMGGKPRLFTAAPTRRLGGGDDSNRNYLKIHVIVAVRMMVKAHRWDEKKARELVAEKFASAGATGRKRGPLSPSTIQDWCDRAARSGRRRLADSVDDVWVRGEVERQLVSFQSDPRWPGEVQDTINWIGRLASSPLLSSKYG